MLKRGFKTWCENAAGGYRAELGLSEVEPLPPDRLAHHLGVKVWRPEDVPGVSASALDQLTRIDPGNWSAVTLRFAADSLVIVNSTHAATRRSSSLAHELAHIILGHDASRVDVSKDGHLLLQSFDRAQEAEADWLSATLLVPREALLWALDHLTSSNEVGQYFGVSHDLLNWRRRMTGVDKQRARRG